MATTYIIYQSVWSPTAGEQLPCRKEPSNIQDPFSVKEETFEIAASIEEDGIRGPLGSGALK